MFVIQKFNINSQTSFKTNNIGQSHKLGIFILFKINLHILIPIFQIQNYCFKTLHHSKRFHIVNQNHQSYQNFPQGPNCNFKYSYTITKFQNIHSKIKTMHQKSLKLPIELIQAINFKKTQRFCKILNLKFCPNMYRVQNS